jgi:predicted metal-dependent RNase
VNAQQTGRGIALKITLLGATGGEVTGSCYLLETASAKVLVHCGMFQGSATSENRNRIPTAARVAQLDAVVLTHAHLDHTGRLPLLAKLGHRAPIYCTRPTVDLATLVLRDAARLQFSDCERENRKRAVQGLARVDPLYGAPDVDALRPFFRTFEYDEPTRLRRASRCAPSRPRLVLTHGEHEAREALARAIAERHGIEAELPDLFDVLEDEPARMAAHHRG